MKGLPWMPAIWAGFFLWGVAGSAEGRVPEPVTANSGHHFAYGVERDNAYIGLDFGHNPYGSSVSFATPGGRARLETALRRAADNGETRMSFDFGFDFRSVVVPDGAGGLRLDDEVLPSLDAFLASVQATNTYAEGTYGRLFSADVVVSDYRMADGVRTEGGLAVGEHPEYLTDPAVRARFMAALAPAFARFEAHANRVTLNLMNEPEFISMPASRAVAGIEAGRWSSARVDGTLRARLSKAGVTETADAASALRALGANAYVSVHFDRATGSVMFSRTQVIPDQVFAFLIEMRRAISREAPGVRTTVGWADDQSALSNTQALEREAGGPVTEDVSFHVYPQAHPLRLSRLDFADAGLDDRVIRITEWGLSGAGGLQAAMTEALTRTRDAGFEGVLFWWDDTYPFDGPTYRAALADFSRLPAVSGAGPPSPDFDNNGQVDFGDFVLLAQRFGTRAGEAGFDARFDLDGDGRIGFGDFLAVARAFWGR